MSKKPTGPVTGHHELSLTSIDPSSTNPRKKFDETKLAELAESIKTFGVLQPIVVRPRMHRYELVAGERRYRAAKLAELKTIPCKVVTLDDRQVLQIQVIENEQREDVSPLEKADGYARLVEEHNVPVEDLAAEIGKSVSTIRGLLKLRNLPELARQAVDDGELPMATAQLIGRIPSAANRERLALHVLAGEEFWREDEVMAGEIEVNRNLGIEALTYRQTKKLVERSLMVELKGAPFATGDKKLLPEAGSCKACPKRVGNLAKLEPEDYAGVRADVCTDPDCYRRKTSAHRDRLEAEARAAGCYLMPEHQSRHMFSPDGSLEFGCGWLDLEDVWNPTATAKKQQTYRAAIGGMAKRHIQAAIDHLGKLHYLIPAKVATQELIAAGLIPDPDKKATNGKPAAGSPEHLADLEERMGLPAGTMKTDVDDQKEYGPSQTVVCNRAARNAGNVLYQMLAEEDEPDLCEPLRLLALAHAEEACRSAYCDSTLLGDGVVTLMDSVDAHGELAAHRHFIGRARPEELVGYMLKSTMIRVLLRADLMKETKEALLDWGQLFWDQLKEQAERELTTGKKAEPKAAVDIVQEVADEEADPVVNGRLNRIAQDLRGGEQQSSAFEGEYIGDLGVTKEAIERSSIVMKLAGTIKEPITVQPFALKGDGNLYVSAGGVYQHGHFSLRALQLYCHETFKEQFPTRKPRLQQMHTDGESDEERSNGYWGVRVRFAKTEYLIGPMSSSRLLTSKAPEPAKAEVHHRLGKAAAKNGSKLHAGYAAGNNGQEQEAVSTKGVCRICKCTEADCRQCIERTGEPCTWTDPSKTLCTACRALLDSNVEDAVELSPKDLRAFNAVLIQTVGQLLGLGKTIFFPDPKLMTKARAECLREEAEQWIASQVNGEPAR